VLAVDVVERPDGLDERIAWLHSPGGAALPAELTGLRDALVIAHEWPDVVPCTVAELDPDGTARVVHVDPVSGEERLGPELGDADRLWAQAHWPSTTPGDRLEVGRTRDEAWSDLVSRVASGLLVAVDYGHVATERPSAGTLTAYRRGVQTEPVPDGTMDLTAHVAVDTLDADEVGRQRDLLRELGVRGATPPHALAATDPIGYLRALERAAAEAELIRPGGFGDFWWAVKRVPGGDVT
jgi:SAM-dependent MidA family methyltransferase